MPPKTGDSAWDSAEFAKTRLVYRLAYDGDVAAGKGKRVGVSAFAKRHQLCYSRVEKQSFFPRRRYANTPTRFPNHVQKGHPRDIASVGLVDCCCSGVG